MTARQERWGDCGRTGALPQDYFTSRANDGRPHPAFQWMPGTTPMLRTVLLLAASNLFMTVAWYGHLRFKHWPLTTVILLSWGIAFFEYCLQVPANRIGHNAGLSGAQLKTIQEVITLAVFVAFAAVYLKEPIRWNVVVGFALIAAGAVFVFRPWGVASAAP